MLTRPVYVLCIRFLLLTTSLPMSTQRNLTCGSPQLTAMENQVKDLIEATEANIARLTGEIHELTVLRERERSVLAILRLTVVPVGKLPTELLSKIFKMVVHTDILRKDLDEHGSASNRWGLFPSSSIFDHREASLALKKVFCLSQVCPYWRQVVNTTPMLWAEGVVRLRMDRKDVSATYTDGLKTLLARSAPSSSQFRWNKRGKRPPRGHRKCALNVSIDLPSFPKFDLPSGAFETLERLHIRNVKHQADPVTVFAHSPRLKQFIFNCFGSKIGLFHMPWSQLTALTVIDDSLGACREILLQCTNLVTATITTSHRWDYPLPAAKTSVTVLPFLTALTVTLSDETSDEIGGLEAFLWPLALPSLTTLDIMFEHEGEIWPMEVFRDFLRRSPNIKQMAFSTCPLYTEDLVDLLQHSASLETLEVACSFDCFADNFWRVFQYSETDLTPLVPQLQTLTLEAVGLGNSDEGLLEDAIRSRLWTDAALLSRASPPRVKRLKKVLLSEHDLSREFQHRVQDLVDQGLLTV
ncbi:hypothetical protein FB45DRAFT_1003199 [Roridomyces roridus]|uniref:F-box domain-containing protein n=1 Tax=Roridomyces roridus TaxID=1738132 RepID=A0AAD7BXE9_9AGAR|nr:hypothetical protein FB45DRAFT_1003199 [Roridomyces roridus]